jgi:hypothetical protein
MFIRKRLPLFFYNSVPEHEGTRRTCMQDWSPLPPSHLSFSLSSLPPSLIFNRWQWKLSAKRLVRGRDGRSIGVQPIGVGASRHELRKLITYQVLARISVCEREKLVCVCEKERLGAHYQPKKKFKVTSPSNHAAKKELAQPVLLCSTYWCHRYKTGQLFGSSCLTAWTYRPYDKMKQHRMACEGVREI